MTAPSYTEDLTDIDSADSDANWEESTDSNWDDGGASTSDSDYPYIQGNTAVTQQATKASISSLLVDNGSGMTLPTDGAYLVWQFFASSNLLETYANGGMRVMVGSSRGDFYSWDVGGRDFGRYPLGGWMNHAVNTTVSADDTVGSPTSTEQYLGAAVYTTQGIGKGNPHAVDFVRYGRCSSIFEYGDLSNGYCTFAGFAASDETNRWGLLFPIIGGYLFKGKMTLGTGSNAVDFRDSNENIFIDQTPKVTANFNTIEVNNASSRVDWTNVKFFAQGTTSPGRLVCNANADLNWEACQFFNMGAFTFGGAASECTNAIFFQCGLITTAGATLAGSQVLESSVTSGAAVGWNVNSDPDGELNDMTFTKGSGTHHAIEFGSNTPSTLTLRGWTVSGFNAADGQNDSVIYNNSGKALTISIVNGTGTFTYKNGSGASTVLSIDPVTVKVHASTRLGADVSGATVFLKASNGTGPFPYQETVTIANSGTTATVTHTGHGMATNDYVDIKGAEYWQNNGVHQITYINANSYSYTIPSNPGSPTAVPITSTFVALYGTTDVNGDKSVTRVYSSDQPVEGWVRKGAEYKSAPLFGAVDSVDGYNQTGVLVND